LFLANLGLYSVDVHVLVDYTSNRKFAAVTLGDISIAPGALQRIELSEELAKLGVIGPAQEASVDVTYNAEPGTLIGELTSVDQRGDYSFEVPIKDPEGLNEMMEGVYPWTIEDASQSVLSLKNTTGETASALLIFEFPEGQLYNPSRIVLQPHQSIAIDIQKLKDSQQPDFLKRVFPAGATRGVVQWRQEIPYSMIGRLERTNVNEGIARSFSCGTDCCGLFRESAYVTPSPIIGPVGGGFTLQARVQGTDCNGAAFDDPTASVTWSSQNTSVATVNSSGSVTFVGPGTTSIVAKVVITQYTVVLNRCVSLNDTQTLNVGTTVTPGITSISPAQGPVGTATPVTINGTGFASDATVNAGSNISVSNVSVTSSTQMKATFTPSNSTSAGGNQAVTVTVNSQKSNSVNFFVQVPAKLVFSNTTCAPNGQGPLQVITNGSVVDCGGVTRATNFCGVNRNLTYQLVDQNGAPFPVAYTLSESFSNLSTTNSALGLPTASTNAPIPANNVVTDAQFVGFRFPKCLGSNDHHSYTQNFSVTLGGVTYSLTTTVSISDGNFNGTLEDNVSITVPQEKSVV
jgi:hypothetical protein